MAVSAIIGNPEVGVIVLCDEKETVQIAIVCDGLMRQEFMLRLSKEKVCNTLLPEVLVNVLTTQVDFKFEIVINDIIDGVYKAMLINTETYQPLSLRASDAVLLHHISKAPLYATTQLLKRQAVPILKGTQSMALPYNALSDDMLLDAMQRAVEVEQYEAASTIRDELKKRGKL